MSGGFFRGTSADQDTRFSNKQAKLLKSQKFAPELENLVDMTKVKMDVMRPWIAKRVTEMIGFEDEVLINFIYTLLEGKEVNGKEIQISLTGFMERNTGKFMKELWLMLLSAQKNVSGVPQQFLDAKEEETRNKRAETDRIANEIQRKKEKEKQETELEKTKIGSDISFRRDHKSKQEVGIPAMQPDHDKLQFKRKEERRKISGWQSPDASYNSRSPRAKLSASPTKSSDSAMYLERKSRSISRHSQSRSRSISYERRHVSSPKRSVTPRGRQSPSPRHRQSYIRRKSTSSSPSRYREHSPRRQRYRSPARRRSRSPARRRSRSPARRRSRSPARRKSRSPARRRSRSPARRRSRSPLHHRSGTTLRRSPVRYRSRTPLRYYSRSPVQHRSTSPRGRSPIFGRQKLQPPKYGNSPSPVTHQKHTSPARRRYHLEHSVSPAQRRSPAHTRKVSSNPAHGISSPQKSASPEHNGSRSVSPVKRGSLKNIRSSPGERARIHEKHSPARSCSPSDTTDIPSKNLRGMRSLVSRPTISLGSPQKDMLALKGKDLPPVRESPVLSDDSGGRNFTEERASSPHVSSYLRKDEMARSDSYEPQANDENILSGRNSLKHKYRSTGKVSPRNMHGEDTSASAEACETGHETMSKDLQLLSREAPRVKGDGKHHEPKASSKTSNSFNNVDVSRDKDRKTGKRDDQMGSNPVLEEEVKRPRKTEQNHQNGFDERSSNKVREMGNRRKLDKEVVESDDQSSYDSYEDRKEAKRRRKEEKKQKREERHRRRAEKHRRRDERRAEKLKLKSGSGGSSLSDMERNHAEDGDLETELEQKRLEIELREKALESLRAKKGLGN